MGPEHIGRYQIVEELGHGSMGVVYKARDPLLDRIVALKTVGLSLSREETEAFEQRFYREAQSAGRLNHANIVTVHDVGKTDSVAYIAMEFLQGQSLREILDSGVVLPVEKIVDIAAQVANGLAFAHESGVVHRDIKPPNIMVLDNGTVKITDFGIALLPTGSRTLAGTVFGSPKYMSPEQVVGRPVDGRADIFSLGAVLYEMLTGFAPFFGVDLEAVLYQVINEMPAAPTTRNKSLPAAFDYIVAKALAKHPDDRYANAEGLAADLRNFRQIRFPGEQAHDARTLERRAIRRRKGDVPPPRESVPAAPADTPAAPHNETVEIDAAPVVGGTPLAGVESGPSVFVTRGDGSQRRNVIFIGAGAAVLILAAATALVRVAGNDTAQSERLNNASTREMPIRTQGEKPTPIIAAERSIAAAATVETTVAPASAVPASPVRASTSTAPLKPVAGRVALAVSPWGEVYVDGRKKGLSPPLTELRLSPGRHTIELRNSTFAPYAETVNVEANASLRIRHKFR
jgi:serine/threonine-protein kinase